MSHEPIEPTAPALSGANSGEANGGRLSRSALVSLSLATFFPAVSLAMVPFLVFTTSGTSAWQASLLATIAVICIGRAVIVFARRYVASGSLYSYVGEVFGPWARYVTAASLFAGFVVGIAALAAVVGVFTGSFLYARGLHEALHFNTQVIVFGAALLVAAFVAFRGLDTSVIIAVVLTVLALPLIIVITVASAMHTGLDLSRQFNFTDFHLGHTLQGIAVGAAFLVGFESCAALATETRDPKRNVPMAIMAVPVVLGGLFPIVTILQVPGLTAASDELAAGVSAPAALAIQAGLGTTVASATDLVLAVASFASLVGFINYGGRFAMALAEGGLLPAALARLHPKHGSPYIAVGLMALLSFTTIAGMLLWTGDIVSAYTPNATLLVYLWVIPYIIICVGAIVLTIRLGEFRPLLWIAAAIGAATMIWAYINGIINPPAPPADSMIWVAGIAIVAVLAVFGVTPRRAHRPNSPDTDETGASVTQSI
ncbi:putative amino acid permease YhdG [Nocardia cerradoensis]|uniref:Putative amino acid permease YhdG n=1 Tax=Nocardia cerradoensis TaxID=85688 RepID=A0A231GX72_9NOCA|nr:APC family permease [Nocardia cerradoensis]OXR41220.1 putative amino acid permease YhdG [Nocardia cerradoensis]